MHPLAPQIEKAVAEPHVLGILGVTVDRERQGVGGGQHLQFGEVELVIAGLTVSAVRAAIRPVRDTTLSSLSASTSPNSGDDTSMTHCVTP